MTHNLTFELEILVFCAILASCYWSPVRCSARAPATRVARRRKVTAWLRHARGGARRGARRGVYKLARHAAMRCKPQSRSEPPQQRTALEAQWSPRPGAAWSRLEPPGAYGGTQRAAAHGMPCHAMPCRAVPWPHGLPHRAGRGRSA